MRDGLRCHLYEAELNSCGCLYLTLYLIPGLDYTYPANKASLCLPRKIRKIEGDSALKVDYIGTKAINTDLNYSIVLRDGCHGSSFTTLSFRSRKSFLLWRWHMILRSPSTKSIKSSTRTQNRKVKNTRKKKS